MPSTTDASRPRSRRRVLAALGTAVAGSLAGCGGRVPGFGPDDVDTVTTEMTDGLRWEYPQTAVADGDADGIGYASVTLDYPLSRDTPAPALRFTLNSTVGDIAASEGYREYEADWFRFRLGPPPAYTSQHPYEWRVQPPPFPDLSVGYDRRAGRRELVVSAPELGTDGTITIPVVFVPSEEPLPAALFCAVTVQASEPGALGETVRTTGRGTLDLESLRER